MMVEEENLNTKKKIDWQEICSKLLLPLIRVSSSYIRTNSINMLLLLISNLKIIT